MTNKQKQTKQLKNRKQQDKKKSSGTALLTTCTSYGLKGLSLLFAMIWISVSGYAMGTSPLIFTGSTPASGETVSSLETITLNWNLENIIRDFGEDTWGVCVYTQNLDSDDEKYYAVLYEGMPETGSVLAVDDAEIMYNKVNAGSTSSLSFPNVTIKPGQLYTVVVTSQFYVQKPKKRNTKLQTASWYDEPITLTFYGPAADGIFVENILPSGEFPIKLINDLQIEFSASITLKDASAHIYEGSDLIATASSFGVDEINSKILLIGFDDVTLYSTHDYQLVVDANSVVDENGKGNEEIKRVYNGASFHELKVGRVSPANNRSVSWLSTIYMPFSLEDGFCLSKVDELTTRLLDSSGNIVVENIPFEQSQDMKSLIFNIWDFNLEPNSSYQFILDANQIYPAYLANPTAKKKDTVNSEVVLTYTTPEVLDQPAKITVTSVPEEGADNDRLDTVILNLADYEFENNSYQVQLAVKSPVAIFSDGTSETTLPLTFNAAEKKATCTVNRPLEEGKTYTLKIPAGTFAPKAHANLAAVAANDELLLTYTGKPAPATEYVTVTYTIEGVSAMQHEVEKGKAVSFTLTPADELWTVGSVENASYDEASGKYVTEPLDADHEVRASFALTRPVEFDYTTEVEEIDVEIAYLIHSDGNNIVVNGVAGGDRIRVYTTGGTLMADRTVPEGMDTASISIDHGVYIVAVNDHVYKVRH